MRYRIDVARLSSTPGAGASGPGLGDCPPPPVRRNLINRVLFWALGWYILEERKRRPYLCLPLPPWGYDPGNVALPDWGPSPPGPRWQYRNWFRRKPGLPPPGKSPVTPAS